MQVRLFFFFAAFLGSANTIGAAHQVKLQDHAHTRNYYQELGVAVDAPRDVILKAYRKLAKSCHDDKGASDRNTFQIINDAYEILGDSDLRREYDQLRPDLFGKEPDIGFNCAWFIGTELYKINKTYDLPTKLARHLSAQANLFLLYVKTEAEAKFLADLLEIQALHRQALSNDVLLSALKASSEPWITTFIAILKDNNWQFIDQPLTDNAFERTLLNRLKKNKPKNLEKEMSELIEITDQLYWKTPQRLAQFNRFTHHLHSHPIYYGLYRDVLRAEGIAIQNIFTRQAIDLLTRDLVYKNVNFSLYLYPGSSSIGDPIDLFIPYLSSIRNAQQLEYLRALVAYVNAISKTYSTKRYLTTFATISHLTGSNFGESSDLSYDKRLRAFLKILPSIDERVNIAALIRDLGDVRTPADLKNLYKQIPGYHPILSKCEEWARGFFSP